MASVHPALLALALAACAPAAAPPIGSPPSPASSPPVDPAPPPATAGLPAPRYEATGAEGDLEVRQLGYWNQSPYQAAERRVVRDAESLERVWADLGSLERRQVDFANDLVVVVAAGQRPTGGYEISVRRAALENGQLLLEVLTTAPGRNCLTTMALTQPVEVVAVRAARAAGWRFVEREDIRDC
jgi:hypothetical protein